nr:transposase [Streptomyces sp. AC495_CC817]
MDAAFAEYGWIAKTEHLLWVVDPVDDTYRRQMNWQFPVQESRYKPGPGRVPPQTLHHPPGVPRPWCSGPQHTVGGPATDALRPLRDPDAVELDLDDYDGDDGDDGDDASSRRYRRSNRAVEAV